MRIQCSMPGLVMVVACVLSGCGNDNDAATATTDADQSAAMVAELRTIADSVDPQVYIYANAARASMLHQQARQASVPAQRGQLLMMSAGELIRAGDTEAAIARLDDVNALLRSGRLADTEQTRGSLYHLYALAYLRLGEQQNCLENHTIESCLMPIPEGGRHQLEQGSRSAIEYYTKLLQLNPRSAQYAWLLNLAAMTVGEYPAGVPSQYRLPESTFESDDDIGRFFDVAGAAGVDTMALSGGAIIEDFDGDGRLDIVASSWGLRDQMRFYRNRGDGTFEDRTSSAGLDGQWGGLNLSHADYDNDGDADILVLRGGWLFDAGEHPNSLLRNDGTGVFTDVTRAAGMYSLKPSQTAAWADYDSDGDLDVFIGCEPTSATRHASELWRNNGDGTFDDVAAVAGLAVDGVVKAVTFGDYNNDGRPDLYVSRFGERNLLFRNAGKRADGTVWFIDKTSEAGVAEPINSFPTWFFDYDNDGWQDLMVGSFAGFDGDSLDDIALDYLGMTSPGETARLYRNRGDGTFEDVSSRTSTKRVLVTMGANFGDVDNDGWLDCYFGTGEPTMTTLVPNVMLRNDNGERFLDITTSGGFGNIQKGHGVAFGDLDHDGDQDMYVTMGGAFEGDLYPNLLFQNPGHENSWVTIRCIGTSSNRFAVGARIAVDVTTPDGPRTIHRVVGTGGSFGSSSLQTEVGLGDATSIEAVTVRWPGASETVRYRDVAMNAVVELRQDATTATVITPPAAPLPAPGSGGGQSHHHGHHNGHHDG
ncbi:MAG: VCBS repeat-containing protein [Planctomycetota bacterium]